MSEMKKKKKSQTNKNQLHNFFPLIHTTDTNLSLKLSYLPLSILNFFLLLRLIYETIFQLVSMMPQSIPFMMSVLLKKFVAAEKTRACLFYIFSFKDYHKLTHTGSLREIIVFVL